MKKSMFYKVYAVAIALAVPVFVYMRNMEFLWYAAIISVCIGFLWYSDRFFNYSKVALTLFTIWLVLHISGGMIPIGDGKVLYNWIIIPLVPEPFSILKFDQFMHMFCYVGIGFLIDDALCASLRMSAKMRFALVTLSAIGIGALNEVMEFAAVCMIPETNIGDYTNNALDLVFNTLGALTAATLRTARPTRHA